MKNFSLKLPTSEVADVKGDFKLRLSILIGENGTAKTTITQDFIDSLESNYEINYVINKEQFRKTNKRAQTIHLF